MRCKQIIVGNHLLRSLHVGEGRRAGVARGVEIDLAIGIEQGHGLDLIGARLHHNILPGRQSPHHAGWQHFRHRAIFRIDSGGGAGDPVLPHLDNGRPVQLSRDDLVDIAFRKPRAGDVCLAQIIAKVPGHGQRLVAYLAQILFIIAARQVARILQHPPCAIGKPELHTILEQQRREDDDQQHRHARDNREYCDQPHMQLPVAPDRRRAGPAFGNAAPEQNQQGDCRHQVRDE